MSLAARDALLFRRAGVTWPFGPLLDMLELLPDADVALAEGGRVLRAGGGLAVAAYGPDHLRETWKGWKGAVRA